MKIVQDKSLQPLLLSALVSGQVFYATDPAGDRTFFIRAMTTDQVQPHVDISDGALGMICLCVHAEAGELFLLPANTTVVLVKPRMLVKGPGKKPQVVTDIARFKNVKPGDVFYQRLHGVRYFMGLKPVVDQETLEVKYRAVNLTTGTGHDFHDDEPVHIVEATLSVAA